jgi:peptidylprolyl isomerase/FKBP-type peptidyl-prolyl cis-trans isomerase FkpA
MESKKNMNIILAVVICLVLIAVLIFISKKDKKNMPQNNDNINSAVTDNTANNNAPVNPPAATNVTPAPTSTTAPATTGEVAKTGDTVAMNYTGRLENGTVFDSNVDPKFGHVQPFEFTLGAGQVIPGWDKGIVGMKVGEEKTLTISPQDGYGSKDYGPIPANSTLIFDVQLLAIKK